MRKRAFGLAMCLLLGLVGVLALGGGDRVSAQPEKKVLLGSATWLSDLPAAQACARETGKPILWLDMVGRLDETWC